MYLGCLLNWVQVGGSLVGIVGSATSLLSCTNSCLVLFWWFFGFPFLTGKNWECTAWWLLSGIRVPGWFLAGTRQRYVPGVETGTAPLWSCLPTESYQPFGRFCDTRTNINLYTRIPIWCLPNTGLDIGEFLVNHGLWKNCWTATQLMIISDIACFLLLQKQTCNLRSWKLSSVKNILVLKLHHSRFLKSNRDCFLLAERILQQRLQNEEQFQCCCCCPSNRSRSSSSKLRCEILELDQISLDRLGVPSYPHNHWNHTWGHPSLQKICGPQKFRHWWTSLSDAQPNNPILRCACEFSSSS